MDYDDGSLEVILKYIPEEILHEICKLERINNLGIRCSRIEEVRRNRESLSRNLLKPINKNHFLKWLLAYFSKVKKENIDSNKENLQMKELFDLLIISKFNGDIELFEVYNAKLKEVYNEDSEEKENNSDGFVNTRLETPSDKLLRKVERKLNNLQIETKEKEEQYNTQKSNLQEKINLLNNELKEMHRKLNAQNKEIVQLKIEKGSLESNVTKIMTLKDDLEFQNSILCNTINELEIKLSEAFKKEVKVIGEFNLSLITDPNIKIDFLSIEELLNLSVINQELWILHYALTPREKYRLESSMKEVEILNKVVKIHSNSELLKLLNTEYPVLMEGIK